MNRSSFTSHRPAVFTAAIVATGLALVGCGPKSSSSSSSGSTSGSTASGKATASASNSGTSGSGLAADSTLFPATVGNTWVYDEDLGLGTAQTGTSTNRIVAVVPTAGGEQVTMSTSEDLPTVNTTSKPAIETLIFHSDGSISLPLTQLGSTSVTIKSGSIVWPSAAELESGQAHSDTLVMTIDEAGHDTTVTADVVTKGAGPASVTVPAGTYQTTLIDETMTEHFDGIAVNVEIQNWDASGVGPVKTAVISTADGKTSTVSSTELKSFTKG
jgi:hypothetical protein